jgi:hypothetical protein
VTVTNAVRRSGTVRPISRPEYWPDGAQFSSELHLTNTQHDTCRGPTTIRQFNGETFTAKLVYTGNNYEAFFTVDDPGVKAYTVYPAGGPFADATYYYLEVLRSVTTTQFWVWDGDQTTNNVSVQNWDRVPGQAGVPVPSVP